MPGLVFPALPSVFHTLFSQAFNNSFEAFVGIREGLWGFEAFVGITAGQELFTVKHCSVTPDLG